MTDPTTQDFWGELTTGNYESEIFPEEAHFFLVTTKTEHILKKVAEILNV